MKVAVEILTGTLFYIQVENNASVADLKREIGAQQKLPCDRLILLLSSDHSCPMSQDHDEVPLADCGVKDGSHIYLFFKPLDDGSTQHSVFPIPEWLNPNTLLG